MTKWLLIPAFALALVGCTPKAAETVDSKQPDPAKGSATPGAGAAPEAAKTTLADIPDELKHNAFTYYGLAYDKPRDLEVRQDGSTFSGSQIFRLVEIKDGKAIFEYEHTGGLAGQGTFTISLEKDGIYTVSSSVAKIKEHELEMPANIEVGTTWNTSTVFQAEGRSLEQTATNKATRIEKVETKAGTFDALLVESSGPAVVDGEKMQMSTKMWFVKDRGVVKMINTRTPPGKKPIVVTMEATS
ncbi:MAG TPA: hypothetical protein VM328_10365 [Fimbriimonadaceae bacterium]|nr:hypothetical protein [Fimbriimonadaceae bacterium]